MVDGPTTGCRWLAQHRQTGGIPKTQTLLSGTEAKYTKRTRSGGAGDQAVSGIDRQQSSRRPLRPEKDQMSRTPRYAKALHALLKPLGFSRKGNNWIRVRGDMCECVDLQGSWLGGVTVNVSAKDLKTAEILEAIPCEQELWLSPITTRVGQLIDRRDRWWKDETNGPAEMAEAVRVYGLPWFDRIRSVEDQAARWYGRHSDRSPWRSPSLPALAVTLYRLGELEEALALFQAPERRTTTPNYVIRCRCVERWLKAQAQKSSDI